MPWVPLVFFLYGKPHQNCLLAATFSRSLTTIEYQAVESYLISMTFITIISIISNHYNKPEITTSK